MLYSLLKHVISPKHSTLNTCSNNLYIRGEGGLAGEGKLVGVPCKFSLPRVIAAMSLTSIQSDWMSNASSGLYIILYFYWSITTLTSQDAHKRLVLQVYLDCSTSEFSAT